MRACHLGRPPVRPLVFVPGWGNVWRCGWCLAPVGPRRKGDGTRVPGRGYWTEAPPEAEGGAG